MAVAVEQIVFDAADALTLARFWSGVLQRPVDPDGNPFFATIGKSGDAAGQPVLMFLQTPDQPVAKNRVHLDLAAPDREAEVQRAVAAGATRVADLHEYGVEWTTLRDPEGNHFDIAQANH